jgi:phospholipid/cholesterol/gamma-HCH transport system permease protein
MFAITRQLSLHFLESIGEYIHLILDVVKSIFLKPPKWNLLREQLYNIGVLSLNVVAITGFTTGFVLAAQAIYQLSEKGMAGITGVLVAKSMITELGPILTAFMVTGRVGSSMCAELGTMKVTEQIDALKSMAINPNAYLVAPRFIAGFIMIPMLTFFCIIMGIIGGYIISVELFNLSSANYFSPMPINIFLFDLLIGFIKSFVFGVLMVTVCCYRGMKTTGGAAGVGKATTQSVVITYILILISDFFLTLALNTIKEIIRCSGGQVI